MEILNEFLSIVSKGEKQSLDSEFRELKFLNFDEMFGNFELNLKIFWKIICEQKRSGINAFLLLRKFVQHIMTLPHSSANVERT